MWVRRDVVGTLARPRRRWVDDTKMNIKEIGWEGGQRIYMAQDTGKWLLQSHELLFWFHNI